MASNYSILQQNLLNSFLTDEAEQAFLWGCDNIRSDPHLHKAEQFAREVEWLSESVWILVSLAGKGCAVPAKWSVEKAADLYEFMLKRHANLRHPSFGRGDYVDRYIAHFEAEAR